MNEIEELFYDCIRLILPAFEPASICRVHQAFGQPSFSNTEDRIFFDVVEGESNESKQVYFSDEYDEKKDRLERTHERTITYDVKFTLYGPNSYANNWENEVQFFDTDTPELTGIVQDINALAWIAPRGGAGINTEGIEQVQEENGYIAESSRYLEQYDEIIDTEGYDTWVRVVQKQVRSETGTTETGHGDYLIYRQGDNGYLAVQSEMDSASWTVWELPGYGEWLDREIAMFIRMSTGM